MSQSWKKNAWKVVGLAVALAVATPPMVRAQEPCGGCASGSCGMGGCGAGSCSVGYPSEHCQHFHCPHTKFCVEGPPCICVRQGCAKPVVNPCMQPNWGYYQTCWAPWPGGPDWSHCPTQPPASLVFPPPGPPHALPEGPPARFPEPGSTLPYPRLSDR